MSSVAHNPDLLTAVYQQAKACVPPTHHERLDRALALVQAGAVADESPGRWLVRNGTGQYLVTCTDGEYACECKDALFQHGEVLCKHVLAVRLYRKVQRVTEAQGEQGEPEVPPCATTEAPVELDQQYIAHIRGQPFCKYAGLLALAHQRGLLALTATFTSVSETLALAQATATFADGRTFTECADSTPANVHVLVKPHFPRMALTRAKARCLRDALNIALVALEELGGEGKYVA